MAFNVIKQFWDCFKTFKNATFLLGKEAGLTYGQVLDKFNGISTRLQEAGISRGERIALLSQNTAEMIILFLALWRIGATVAVVNRRWPPGLISKTLLDIACDKLIVASKFEDKISLEEFTFQQTNLLAGFKFAIRKNPIEKKMALPRGTATILFTSGSSGQPKAVVHSLSNHIYSALGSNQNIQVSPGDSWMLSLPCYHAGGMAIVFRVILGGGSITLPELGEPLQEVLRNPEVTHLSLVPTQLYRLMQHQDIMPRLRRLKAILLGGSSIPVRLINEAAQHNLPIFTSYGSTEMASQITTTAPGEAVDNLQTSGKLLPYRQLEIAADGEILVKGKTLCLGYMNAYGLQSCTDEKGWFGTGDLGSLDREGYLTVTGRKDNMFISGGENIQPEEIESALTGLSRVEEAVVVPVKDEEFGQRPVAFVKTFRGQPVDEDDLEKRLRKVLPGFKIPRNFLPWPKREEFLGLKIKRTIFQQNARELID